MARWVEEFGLDYGFGLAYLVLQAHPLAFAVESITGVDHGPRFRF